MRLHYGFPFTPIQILTGDTRKGCALRHRRLLDERRSCQRKSRIGRRFESSPGVQRFANLWGTFGSFRTSEKNKTVSLTGKLRGSANIDSARRNGDFALTKLKPFPKKASRFSKPRISAPKPKLRTSPIKSFAAPRLISALRRCHVAAATFFAALWRLLFPTFCKVQKVGQKTL